MMIRIGITESDTNFHNYPAWIQGDGVEVIVLSFREQNKDDFTRCDGFLLSGGVDMHPSGYGNTRVEYPWATSFNEPRDAFEREVFAFACLHEKPVLAICRGLQLVNAALGGNLIQDLQEQGFSNHRKGPEADGEHAISVEPASLLRSIAGQDQGLVNSAHHQGLDRIAETLRVSAWSEDRVVEAIEYIDFDQKPFFLGVQWHPERLRIPNSQNAFSMNIRQAFLDAASNTSK
jgi:putative glutamine amidotransferase